MRDIPYILKCQDEDCKNSNSVKVLESDIIDESYIQIDASFPISKVRLEPISKYPIKTRVFIIREIPRFDIYLQEKIGSCMYL